MGKKWLKQTKPFTNIEEWETEKGTKVKVGEKIHAKPDYIKKRLPAKVINIYWRPTFLMDRKKPQECLLIVEVEFLENSEYPHMEGKHETIKGLNIDFSIGGISEHDPELAPEKVD